MILRVEIFEWFSQKYNPFLAELLAIYKGEKSKVKKSSNNKGLYDIGCKKGTKKKDVNNKN
ncbi:hypothetical protein CJ999_32950 [Bacillus thuringiensis]|nr:hypothetical protein [Bacillus thuringiensis]